MVATQHPSELNPLQLYRQASSVLRGTSRATNDGWYQRPFDLDFQLHLKLDGSRAEGWYHHVPTGTWSPAPEFSQDLILDPAKATTFAESAIAAAKKANATALGVVLHIADEFALTEIKPELDNPGALAELRETAIHTPLALLDDSSLSADEHSWRLIPFPAAGSESIATAVILSHQSADFVKALRDCGISKNFPLVVDALSAPLVALLALPEIKTGSNEQSFIAVLPYARFTILAFFNEHGDLRMLRTLQHRGQRSPSNLRHAISTTAVALEMATPEIFVLPMSGEADPQFVADLRIVFEQSKLHVVDWNSTSYYIAELPSVPPEALITNDLTRELETPLASSHTFSTLRADGWSTQDFLPIPIADVEKFPNRGEMKLLRAARFARLGMAAVGLIVLLWVGFGILDLVRRPEWTFKSDEATVVNSRLKMLGEQRQKISHWDNLLDDRSKGWAAMELVARLFPDKSGFLVKGFTHSINPENAPGQTEAGFVKEWKITGFAREESLQRLADLNTREGISAAFIEVARVTGNQAYSTDLPSRSLVVNVRTQENNAFRQRPPEENVASDESSYPFLFDLTITQRFEAADPMALKVAQAP